MHFNFTSAPGASQTIEETEKVTTELHQNNSELRSDEMLLGHMSVKTNLPVSRYTLLKIKVLHDAIEETFCLNGSIKNL